MNHLLYKRQRNVHFKKHFLLWNRLLHQVFMKKEMKRQNKMVKWKEWKKLNILWSSDRTDSHSFFTNDRLINWYLPIFTFFVISFCNKLQQCSYGHLCAKPCDLKTDRSQLLGPAQSINYPAWLITSENPEVRPTPPQSVSSHYLSWTLKDITCVSYSLSIYHCSCFCIDSWQ